MYNFTENEKLAALHLVDECLSGMGGDRPMDLEDDPFTWCHAEVLTYVGWSKHEAAGTYGALAEKGAIHIEKDVSYHEEGSWMDTISHNLYEWAESHWDEFVYYGKPTKLFGVQAATFTIG